MSTNERRIATEGPEETRQAASAFARELKPGTVVALYGDLGAGKTCWVQGMAEGLEVTQAVSSPTYTLINEYAGRIPLYHADLYRIVGEAGVLDLGLEEYLSGDGVTAIEWAERAPSLIPADAFRLQLEAGEGSDQRVIRISGGPES